MEIDLERQFFIVRIKSNYFFPFVTLPFPKFYLIILINLDINIQKLNMISHINLYSNLNKNVNLSKTIYLKKNAVF